MAGPATESRSPKGTLELVLFSLDEGRYALGLHSVERVVRAVEIAPLPDAPDIVLGVINVQGQIVPMVNMRRRFGLPERPISPHDQIVVATDSRRSYGLAVDSVQGIAAVSEDQIVEAEHFLSQLPLVHGVVKMRDGLILVHDIARFLSLEEQTSLEEALKRHDG